MTAVQPFRVEVPSRSREGHLHTITRHPDGTIAHSPGCKGFEHRGECWHVRRARAMVDYPAETFVADVLATWGSAGIHDPTGFGPAIVREAQAAKARIEARARWVRDTAVDRHLHPDHASRVADAIETFG